MALKSSCGLKEHVLVCRAFRPLASYHLISLLFSPYLTSHHFFFFFLLRKQTLDPVVDYNVQHSHLLDSWPDRGKHTHAQTHCQNQTFPLGVQILKLTPCVSLCRTVCTDWNILQSYRWTVKSFILASVALVRNLDFVFTPFFSSFFQLK